MATQVTESRTQKLRASGGDELAVIAQRAQAFTNASGAAIALSEGNADEIICRTRSGSSAPDVGASLRVEGSFAGLCIQSGKELRCDDAETDTRVDSAAIRALGIRSMVVTPIKEENKTIGVLAVFAPTAHAFTITHVAVLKTMADQISALLQRDRKPGEGPSASAPRPVVAAPPVAAPAPVVVKPAPAAAASAPGRPVPVARVEPIRVEPVKSAPLADEVATPKPVEIAKRGKERRREEHRAQPAARVNLGTLDSMTAPSSRSGSKGVVIGVMAVLVVGAAGVFGFLKLRHVPAAQPAAATTVPSAPVRPAEPPPATAAPNVPAPVTAVPEETTPQASTPEVSAKSSVPDESPRERTATRKPEKDNRSSQKNSQRASEHSTQKTSAEQDSKSATVAISAGRSRIAAGSSQSEAQVVAPTLALGGTGPGQDLSSLAHTTATPAPAMIEHSSLVPAKPIRQVMPIVPPIARGRMGGSVVVKFKIGKDGRVSNPQYLSGPRIFEQAAFDAVKQWTYKPATLNGAPIEQEVEVRLNFPKQN